jgi:hypothetical protein
MLTTDGQGHELDLRKTPEVRYYVLASFQHGTGNGASEGICRQLQNPLNSAWVEKALLVDLDEWVSNGTAPPPNHTDHPWRNTGAVFATIRSGLSEHPELQLGDELERHRRLHLLNDGTDPEPIILEPCASRRPSTSFTTASFTPAICGISGPDSMKVSSRSRRLCCSARPIRSSCQRQTVTATTLPAFAYLV